MKEFSSSESLFCPLTLAGRRYRFDVLRKKKGVRSIGPSGGGMSREMLVPPVEKHVKF